MRLLVEEHVTGLPVVDAEGRLAGIVSEKDMLALLYETCPADASVSQFMSVDVVRFGPNDDLVDVCECLIHNHFRRVPIVEDDRLVGLISRRDIIQFILKVRSRP